MVGNVISAGSEVDIAASPAAIAYIAGRIRIMRGFGGRGYSVRRRTGCPVVTVTCVSISTVHVLAPRDIHRLDGRNAALVGEDVEI